MVRKIILTMIVILTIFFSGCGPDPNSPPNIKIGKSFRKRLSSNQWNIAVKIFNYGGRIPDDKEVPEIRIIERFSKDLEIPNKTNPNLIFIYPKKIDDGYRKINLDKIRQAGWGIYWLTNVNNHNTEWAEGIEVFIKYDGKIVDHKNFPLK